MSKTPLSPIQTDCELGLESRADAGRASRIDPKVKLHGRRGYGDADIPAPDRTPDGD